MALSNHKKIYVSGIIGLLYFIMLSFPVKAKEVKILSLTAEQKSTLAKAKNWKIEVHHDYGRGKKYSGIPIVKDCKRILEGAGWQVIPPDSSSYDVLLEISVIGRPQGAAYTTGFHYSGARIEIKASVKIPDKKWAFTFSKSSASQSCPFSISRSYKNPESAPFRSVYYKNRDFFSQLFSIIYLSKGIEPVSLAMKDSSHRDIQAYVHFLAGETKDKRLVIPLLVSINNMTGNVKKEAVVALGKIGDQEAIPALCKALLEDKNSSIREKAAEALGKIGDPKATDALSKALIEDKNRNVRLRSAEALDKTEWKPASTKEKVFYFLAKNKKQDIKRMGKEVLPVLIEALNHSNPSIRQDGAEILGDLKFAEATGPLCNTLVKDTSIPVRQKTVDALGKIGDTEAIPSLCIALLEDKDYSIRANAAEALGKIGDSKATDALSKALLKDKNIKVREKAAEALGKIGDPKAAGALSKALLKDKSRNVQLKSDKALNKLGWKPTSTKEKVFYFLAQNKKQDIMRMGKDVLPVLIEALNHSNPSIRQDSVEILGNLKFAEATGPLCMTLVKDTSLSVRKKTVDALGKIGDTEAIPALCITLLEDKNSSIREKAAEALGKIGDQKAADALSKALLEDKNSNTRGKAAEALGKIGDQKAADALSKALLEDKNRNVRLKSDKALDKIGWKPTSTKEKVFYFLARNKKQDIMRMGKEVLPVLIEALNHSNASIRQDSVEILGDLKFAEATGPLCETLVKDTSLPIRKKTVEALGKIGDTEAIPSLCIALLEDKNINIREKAAEALGKIGDQKAAGALSKALIEDKNRNVSRKSAVALDKIGWKPAFSQEKVFYSLAKNKKQDIMRMGKEVLPALIEALDHSNSFVRQDSAEILGDLKFAEATRPLCNTLEKDTSLSVRKKTVDALGEIGDPEAIPSLCIALLEDKNSNIREKAAEALGKIGDPKVADALSKALLKDKSRNVRLKSAEALGKIGNKKAIESLITKLKTEKDKAVKKAISNALFALGTEEKIPLEFRIEGLKERKDWKKLDTLLLEQTTENLIEQLKTKDKVIRGMVAKVLMERTGRFELGTNYNAWKNWLKKK